LAERIIAEGVEAYLGERLKSVRPLGGGCIGEVHKVELADGTSLVAKVDREGESHLEREAYMLRYLRAYSELPVPTVHHGSEGLLLMEFIEGTSNFSHGAEHHAAELLAALHGITAEAYGHERNTLIGNLDQPNPWTESWLDFFRDHRLLYIAEIAHKAGRLPLEDLRRIERLAGRLEAFIGEPNPPALVHGDVWRGNVLANGNRISAFLDPAILLRGPRDRTGLHQHVQLFRHRVLRAVRGDPTDQRRILRDSPRPLQPVPAIGAYLLLRRWLPGLGAEHPEPVRVLSLAAQYAPGGALGAGSF